MQHRSEEGEQRRVDALRAARKAKLDAVFGEGREWEISCDRRLTKQFVEDHFEGGFFTTFISSSKHRSGWILQRVSGPPPSCELPHPSTEDVVLVGNGLLRRVNEEYPGVIRNFGDHLRERGRPRKETG